VAPGDRLALNVSSQIADGELVRAQSVATTGATPVAASGH